MWAKAGVAIAVLLVGCEGVDIVGIIEETMGADGSGSGMRSSNNGVGGLGTGIVDSIEAGRIGLGADCCHDFGQHIKWIIGSESPSQY